MKFLGSVLAGFAILLLSKGFGATTIFQSPDGFSVTAPVQLVTDGPEQSTTNAGKPYTRTFYSGFSGDDYYFAEVSTYPFAVVSEDLQRAESGFASSFGGKITDTENLTVSGQPALQATITSPEITYRYLVVYGGNKLLQLAYSGTGDPTAFLSSAKLN